MSQVKYHNVVNFSKYVINYCHNKKVNITNLALIKILYLIAVDYYNMFTVYLFPIDFINFDGKILGPQIETVWVQYCFYTAHPLPYQHDYVEVVKD